MKMTGSGLYIGALMLAVAAGTPAMAAIAASADSATSKGLDIAATFAQAPPAGRGGGESGSGGATEPGTSHNAVPGGATTGGQTAPATTSDPGTGRAAGSAPSRSQGSGGGAGGEGGSGGTTERPSTHNR